MRRIVLAVVLVMLPCSLAMAQANRHGPSIYSGLRGKPGIYDGGPGSSGGSGGYRGGHYHGGGHHHYINPYGYGWGWPYSYGYGYRFGYPGYGFGSYVGPAYTGPMFNPPIFTSGYGYGYGPNYSFGIGYGPAFGYGANWNFTGYGYNRLGYSNLGYTGLGGSYGYGSAWMPSGPDPVNNQMMQQLYNNDWTRLRAELASRATRNLIDPSTTTTAVPRPSTPEAKIKSLRFQSQGDQAFADQNYRRAYERYRSAAQAARDDGVALMKTGYALFALGQYEQSLQQFRRAFQIDPLLAQTGPPPTEVYGNQHIAWTTHLGRLTQWVAEDVRDYNRVLLMGTLLQLNGDTRGTEFLEKAWQLSGGREPMVVTLLQPPALEVATPAPLNNQQDQPAAPNNAQQPAETEDPTDDIIPAPPQLGAPPANPENEADQPDTPPLPRDNTPLPHVPLFPLPSEQG